MQGTTRQTAATERTRREQYAQWRQEMLTQLRAALPSAELAALEAAHQARLVAEGTPAYALGLAVRLAVDEVLEARASLPSFEAWRQTQEVS
jgi:isoaspartyl peptidase/L-asparaginase-like protein (Ntn-hydrolase superfamily)